MKVLHDQYKVLNEKDLFLLNGGYGSGSGGSSGSSKECRSSGYGSGSAGRYGSVPAYWKRK